MPCDSDSDLLRILQNLRSNAYSKTPRTRHQINYVMASSRKLPHHSCGQTSLKPVFAPPVRWLLGFTSAALRALLLSSSSSSTASSAWRCAGPQPPAPDESVPHRTSTTRSGWQCPPPDTNRQLWMAVFPTSTASSGRQCSLLDLNHQLRMAVFLPHLNGKGRVAVSVFPAEPQPSAPDGSVPRRTSTVSSGRQLSPLDLNRESEDMPDRTPERMSKNMQERMSEDLPGRMSENMPDRMSEEMPERMSENLL